MNDVLQVTVRSVLGRALRWCFSLRRMSWRGTGTRVGSDSGMGCGFQRASLEALIREARMFPVQFEELSRLQELVGSAEVLSWLLFHVGVVGCWCV